MLSKESIEKRLSRFAGKWNLQPASYQLRNPDGSKGGWVAQVRVLNFTDDALKIQPLMETNVMIYDTAEEANTRAVLMGLNWLESNA